MTAQAIPGRRSAPWVVTWTDPTGTTRHEVLAGPADALDLARVLAAAGIAPIVARPRGRTWVRCAAVTHQTPPPGPVPLSGQHGPHPATLDAETTTRRSATAPRPATPGAAPRPGSTAATATSTTTTVEPSSSTTIDDDRTIVADLDGSDSLDSTSSTEPRPVLDPRGWTTSDPPTPTASDSNHGVRQVQKFRSPGGFR